MKGSRTSCGQPWRGHRRQISLKSCSKESVPVRQAGWQAAVFHLSRFAMAVLTGSVRGVDMVVLKCMAASSQQQIQKP